MVSMWLICVATGIMFSRLGHLLLVMVLNILMALIQYELLVQTAVMQAQHTACLDVSL